MGNPRHYSAIWDAPARLYLVKMNLENALDELEECGEVYEETRESAHEQASAAGYPELAHYIYAASDSKRKDWLADALEEAKSAYEAECEDAQCENDWREEQEGFGHWDTDERIRDVIDGMYRAARNDKNDKIPILIV